MSSLHSLRSSNCDSIRFINMSKTTIALLLLFTVTSSLLLLIPSITSTDVVVLGGNNFSDFVTRNRYVMLNFHASWCKPCNRLAPEYAAAATMLKGEAVLAKIDANRENELPYRYKINGYPAMLLLVDGAQKAVYTGSRTRDAIATWVRQKMGEHILSDNHRVQQELSPELDNILNINHEESSNKTSFDEKDVLEIKGLWAL